MQDTSREAYKDIISTGRLGSQKQEIVECVREFDRGFGMSLQEISKKTGFQINAVSGRVNTLKKESILAHTYKRKCYITARTINPVKLYNGMKEEL